MKNANIIWSRENDCRKSQRLTPKKIKQKGYLVVHSWVPFCFALKNCLQSIQVQRERLRCPWFGVMESCLWYCSAVGLQYSGWYGRCKPAWLPQERLPLWSPGRWHEFVIGLTHPQGVCFFFSIQYKSLSSLTEPVVCGANYIAQRSRWAWRQGMGG